MIFIVKFLASIMLLAMFIYNRIKPVETKMYPQNQDQFAYIKRGIEPILNSINQYIKPKEIGPGLSIDVTQIILVIILIVIISL